VQDKDKTTVPGGELPVEDAGTDYWLGGFFEKKQ